MQSKWQMGLIPVSADKEAFDVKEGNYSFSLCIGKAEYYKFAWCTFLLILDQSSETPCLFMSPSPQGGTYVLPGIFNCLYTLLDF